MAAAGVACVKVHDGPLSSYVFDAEWGTRLGFATTSTASGFGPYPRYGRTVQTGRDLGPLGSADAAGAQTDALLAELGYPPSEIAALRDRQVIT